MRFLHSVLLLILIPLTLHAAITVTYDPAPTLSFMESETPLPTNKLVAKLGTLTFDCGNDPLHHPTLIAITISHKFEFEGPLSSGNGGYETGPALFRLYAVSTDHKGTKSAKLLNDSEGNHALQSEQGNVNVDRFIVDLYLVSELNLSQFKLDSTYTLSDGDLGGFQIGVGSSGPDTKLPVNNMPADSPTPILPPGVDPEEPSIDYGDPPDTVICTFSIIDEQALELHEVYNEGSAVVATAQINLLNVSDTYGVTLTFTNAADTSPFLMKLQGTMANPPTIEYKLLFNNTLLDPGDSVDWVNLTDGTSTEYICVTSINPTAAQTRLSGSYSDTVYVNITPIDSQ